MTLRITGRTALQHLHIIHPPYPTTKNNNGDNRIHEAKQQHGSDPDLCFSQAFLPGRLFLSQELEARLTYFLCGPFSFLTTPTFCEALGRVELSSFSSFFRHASYFSFSRRSFCFGSDWDRNSDSDRDSRGIGPVSGIWAPPRFWSEGLDGRGSITSSRQTMVSARAFEIFVFRDNRLLHSLFLGWHCEGGRGLDSGIRVGSVRAAELGWGRGLGITPALSLLRPFWAWRFCGCCF